MPKRSKEVVHSLHDSRWLLPIEPLRRGGRETEREEEVREELEEFDPFRVLEEEVTTKCTSCQYVVDGSEGRDALRAHYQSPWHRHNVRRSQQGRPILTEEQFEDRKNEDEDSASMSSSESDDDYTHTSLTSARVFFVQDDNVYSVYRSILIAGETEPSRALFVRPLNCAVLLLAGGHFAGAVFKNDNMVVHKTFQRYVVRAKQGGAQSANDNAKGAAHSAGAALRRYNERTLRNEIGQLLKTWCAELAATPLIFLRCATYQRAIFHGEGGIDREDGRLRTIPFETRRPSLDELRRTRDRLATVVEHGNRDEFLKEEKRRRDLTRQRVALQRKKREENSGWLDDASDDESTTGKERVRKTDHLKPVSEVEVAAEDDKWPAVPSGLRREVYEAVRADDANRLMECVEREAQEREAVVAYLSERRFAPDSSTFLHIAASRGLEAVLKTLLDLGCNPSVKNMESRVPYLVSMNKSTKKVFIDYRSNNPKQWEWTRCHIPEPVQLTEEQAALLAEKKREKKNRQKEKMKEKKEIQKKEAAEQAAQAAFLALPEREKRARAAEARLRAMEQAEPRCCNCGSVLPSVPFEYKDVRLCSPACVAAHRAKFN